jgi:hypothetical protein
MSNSSVILSHVLLTKTQKFRINENINFSVIFKKFENCLASSEEFKLQHLDRAGNMNFCKVLRIFSYILINPSKKRCSFYVR